uniref:RNA-directed RNA polymerase L n=1 Tax=Henipavirus hendraense TaxID=3052223 RepID=F4YH99_9MONO|nr:polymerase [Henipavirus hendraense]
MAHELSISDIIYPECHLDSPIVSGKLISAIEYAQLRHNQPNGDKRLTENIKINLQGKRRSVYISRQSRLGNYIRDNIKNLKEFLHVSYPECNKSLFSLKSPGMTSKLSNIMKKSFKAYNIVSRKIIEMLQNITRNLITQDQKDEVLGIYEQDRLSNIGKYMSQSQWYECFLFWFTIKTEMRAVIKNSQKPKFRSDSCIIHMRDNNMEIVMNPNLVCIYKNDKDGKRCYYLTPEIVLMCCDVLEGRMMIETSIKSDIKYQSLITRSNALWTFIDSLFPIMGNRIYNIVSMIEPLVLALLQLKDEARILRGAFLHHCIKEIHQELIECGFTDQKTRSIFIDDLLSVMNIDNIHLLAEFFSFFRTFGHPILEAKTAADKVREHMLADKVLEYGPIMKAHAIFCGTIINGYRDRHGGAWPPLYLPSHASKHIIRLKNSGESLTVDDCVKNWESFCGIQFDCFMELKLDSDLSMYMKDKALSPIKEEWDSVYPREVLNYTPPRSTEPRRLVDVFVNDENFDPYNMLEYVLTGDYLTDEQFNVSYSLKEKETKQAGRLFAKMTYKMRACQVIAEALIASGVGKYFKENGMVKDEHELLKTLFQLSISSVPRGNSQGRDSEFSNNTEKSLISLKRTTGRLLNNEVPCRMNIMSALIDKNQSDQKKHNILPNTRNRHKCDNTSKTFLDYHMEFSPYKSDRTDRTETSDFSKYDDGTGTKFDTVSAFLTTDLKKFCLNWRYESMAIFAERLDEIYGLPGFFNWMHKRLEKSVIYVADPNCPPDIGKHINLDDTPEDDIFIHSPKGGIEGYSQKTWTIATIPFLFLSAYETNTRIAAIVQGDNESIAITQKVHPNLPYKVKKEICARQAQLYFDRLRMNLRALGHNLKATETIISTHLFVYSKKIHYDGAVLSQALKSMSRCCFWSETLVDETRSACSNISTTIAKAIENGLSRNVGYCINVLKVIQQLLISTEFSINETLTADVTSPISNNLDWLVTASLIPAPIGGFNYLNLSRIFVRNIGDPVTASLADLKRMIEHDLMTDKVLQKVMNQEPGDASFLDWASDPYSGNLPDSQSITKTIKNITARTILRTSPNPMLKGLFHDKSFEEDLELATFLMDRRIILPRAAHEILDNSLTGAREEIAGLLDTTKGLIRSGLKKSGIQPKLVSRLSNHDYNQFLILNRLLSNKKRNDLISPKTCSVDLAKALRCHMWRDLALGRSIYGLEVPDALEAMTGRYITGSMECQLCDQGNTMYGWFFVPRDSQLDQVNKEHSSIRVPYVGSSTDERSDIKLGNVKRPTRALRSAIRIATVYTWAYGDSEESWYEAWYLASQRVNIDIDVLKAITPVSTSNNLSHRLRDRSTQFKFAGSVLNRVSRYVNISNDNLDFRVEGEKVDTNLIYQQTMLLGLSVLEGKFRLRTETDDYNGIYHLHVRDNCCVKEVADIGGVNAELPVPEYTEVENNRLIYDPDPVSEIDCDRLSKQESKARELDFPLWSTEELHDVLAKTVAQTVLEIITKADKDVLKQHLAIDSDDSINSLITEFLMVDPELFALYLGQSISVKWAFEIHHRRPHGRHTMVDLLSDLISNTSKHTYKVLSNALSHPRVFKRFVNCGLLLPTQGPYLHQQDFEKLSQNLLITSYMNYLMNWCDFKKFPFLIAEQDEAVVELREDIITSKHLCMIIDLYANHHKPPWIIDLNPQEKICVLRDFISKCRHTDVSSRSWNVTDLDFMVFYASLTYLRRGIIKQLRIRQVTEVIDTTTMLRDNILVENPPIKTGVLDIRGCIIYNLEEILSMNTKSTSRKVFNLGSKLSVENHKYRRIGLNSSSCYKALNLSPLIQRYLPAGSQRLFVGEGSGSMMLLYQQTLGCSISFYNSGIDGDYIPGQRELRLFPSEYSIAEDDPSQSDKLKGLVVPLFNGRPETTWIGNLDSYEYIINRTAGRNIGLVHSDMESGIDKQVEEIMIEHSHLISIAINVMIEDGVLVSKIAFAPGFPISRLLNMYRSYFGLVLVCFPVYSNPESTEVYLICLQKTIKTIIPPQKVLDHSYLSDEINDQGITSVIFKIKNIQSKQFHEDLVKHYQVEQPFFVPSHITCDEKLLMQAGLKMNGPEILKNEVGYDIGSDINTLRSTIIILLNEAMNYFDDERSPSHHLEPFPVLEKTRVKTIMGRVTRKVTVYSLIKLKETKSPELYNIKNYIRRKVLILDFRSHTMIKLLPKGMKERREKSGFKEIWIFDLSNREVKIWWKIIGYLSLV